MAGLLAMSEAGIAGLEEPEAHLSWEGQRRVAHALRTLTLDGSRPPYQLFVSTHSSLMEDMYPGETVYYNVTMTAGETQVERSQDRERLQARFATPQAGLLIPRRLHSANLVRLSDEAVEHLAAEPGELLFEVPEEDRSLRLITEKQMATNLGGAPVGGDAE
jgi:hypothetical protein